MVTGMEDASSAAMENVTGEPVVAVPGAANCNCATFGTFTWSVDVPVKPGSLVSVTVIVCAPLVFNVATKW